MEREREREDTLTFYGVILNVFICHRRRHGKGVTPDTGSDVRDAEGQCGALGLVDKAWHGCRLAAVLSHTELMFLKTRITNKITI